MTLCLILLYYDCVYVYKLTENYETIKYYILINTYL